MSPSKDDTDKAGQGSTFAPGFRLSVVDVLVLLAGAWATWHFAQEFWWLGAVIGFVVGHFFLFCNVIRMSRGAELGWAAVFVLLSGATIATEYPGWAATFAGSLVFTLILVLRETKQPYYHGIGWQRLNPKLRDWWESRPRRDEPL